MCSETYVGISILKGDSRPASDLQEIALQAKSVLSSKVSFILLSKILLNYINNFQPRLTRERSGDYLLLVSWHLLSEDPHLSYQPQCE